LQIREAGLHFFKLGMIIFKYLLVLPFHRKPALSKGA